MNTPNLDATLDHAEWLHLVQWLDHAVCDDEHATTIAAVDAGLGNYPDAIARGLTWREIADRA